MFSDEKEVSIVSTVLANNKIRLCELREQIIADQITFAVINTVCISRLSRILKKHISLKQLYRVPYERNSKYHLVCCHQCISVHHHSILSPYNTALIICFLETLHDTVVQDGPEQPQFVVIWDNVSFHRAALVRDWFTNHNRFIALNLPPYTQFLNPIEPACLFYKPGKRHAATLRWDPYRVGYEMQGWDPCAESYSACVLSYDTVSQSLQHVCKLTAKTVIQWNLTNKITQ